MKANLIMSLLLVSLTCYSQNPINAVTEDGKNVSLYSDGTWRYSEIESTVTDSESSLSCEDLVEVSEDKMTGKSTASSKEFLLISDDGGDTGFGILIFKTGNTIVYSISVVGAGSCIDEGTKAQILFRDGSRSEIVSSGKFNCDRKFTAYLGGMIGSKKDLESFRSKEVETMRIWTSDGYVEKDFTSDNSMLLMKTTSCLVDL